MLESTVIGNISYEPWCCGLGPGVDSRCDYVLSCERAGCMRCVATGSRGIPKICAMLKK